MTLKLMAVLLAPITLIGYVIARQEVTGDQYVAVLELIGSSSQPGAIEIFGADVQTLTLILNFFQTWSLPALIAIVALGIIGLVLSNDKLRATWHIFLGLFFAFGLWAVLLTRSREAFTDFLGTEISDLSAIVIAAYLSELSAKLLNLTGLLALIFGVLALLTWLQANRRNAK